MRDAEMIQARIDELQAELEEVISRPHPKACGFCGQPPKWILENKDGEVYLICQDRDHFFRVSKSGFQETSDAWDAAF